MQAGHVALFNCVSRVHMRGQRLLLLSVEEELIGRIFLDDRAKPLCDLERAAAECPVLGLELW